MMRKARELVFVAMMAGSFNALGCMFKVPSVETEGTAHETAMAATAADLATADLATADLATADLATADLATAPSEKAKGATTVRASVNVGSEPQPPALPAPRVESPGQAPSARHVWQHGFWRWDAPRTTYAWEPGFWELEVTFAPFGPPPVRSEEPGVPPAVGLVFVPGYWRWDGHAYRWVGGRWEGRREGQVFVGPRYERVGTRWQFRPGRWEHSEPKRHRPVRHGDERKDHRPHTTHPVHPGHRGHR